MRTTDEVREQQAKNRRDWVKALRSGQYQQGRKQLKDTDFFCCLGVACDISGKSEWKGTTYLSNKNYMPQSVMALYGLNRKDGDYKHDSLPEDLKRRIVETVTAGTAHAGITSNLPVSLAEVNDFGDDFELIADIIEAEPEGLLRGSYF